MTNWLFIKKRKGNMVRAELYGSVTAMHQGEKIKITRHLKRRVTGGTMGTYPVTEVITETVLRNTLIDNNDKYVDDNYHIEKKEVKRSKHKK